MDQRIRSSLRWPVAALLVLTAGVHLPLVPEHLRSAPYAGVLFVALSGACVALAFAVVLRDTPMTWELAGVLALGTLSAFVASRTVGLPQLGDDIGNWREPLGFPALMAESSTALCAVYVLRDRLHTQRKAAS